MEWKVLLSRGIPIASVLLGAILSTPVAAQCSPNSLPGIWLDGLRDGYESCKNEPLRSCKPYGTSGIGGVDGFLIREFGKERAGVINAHPCSHVINHGLLMWYDQYMADVCKNEAKEIAQKAFDKFLDDRLRYCSESSDRACDRLSKKFRPSSGYHRLFGKSCNEVLALHEDLESASVRDLLGSDYDRATRSAKELYSAGCRAEGDAARQDLIDARDRFVEQCLASLKKPEPVPETSDNQSSPNNKQSGPSGSPNKTGKNRNRGRDCQALVSVGYQNMTPAERQRMGSDCCPEEPYGERVRRKFENRGNKWTPSCVLSRLCRNFPNVVNVIRSGTVTRERGLVEYQVRFDGRRWRHRTIRRGGFDARGTGHITIDDYASCDDATADFVHEVTHQTNARDPLAQTGNPDADSEISARLEDARASALLATGRADIGAQQAACIVFGVERNVYGDTMEVEDYAFAERSGWTAVGWGDKGILWQNNVTNALDWEPAQPGDIVQTGTGSIQTEAVDVSQWSCP